MDLLTLGPATPHPQPEISVKVNWPHLEKGEEQGENVFLRKPRSSSLEIQDACQNGKLGAFLITHMDLQGIKKSLESLLWR